MDCHGKKMTAQTGGSAKATVPLEEMCVFEAIVSVTAETEYGKKC
jgi:hypothetical protein